jgi:hypothetical protein
VVESKNCKANIGSGHQVLTIDRDILFETIPTNPSLTLVGGTSENDYVDFSIDKANKLRLSTYHNYAYHMGNKLENWMVDLQNDNKKWDSNINYELNSKSIDLHNNWFFNKYFGLKKKIVKKLFNIFYKK